jgi:hypothetical protein
LKLKNNKNKQNRSHWFLNICNPLQQFLFVQALFISLIAQAQSSYKVNDYLNGKAHQTKNDTFTLFYPGFYFRETKTNKDTTWKFECYDMRDSIIHDQFPERDEIHYFSLFKTYTDSAHTYIDEHGKKQLLPTGSILKRYDKLGADKWMCIDYATNKFTVLKEDRDKIIGNDTFVITDPTTGYEINIYSRFYKVSGQ